MEKPSKDQKRNKKSSGNNQWTNPHAALRPDNRERRDGPGGE